MSAHTDPQRVRQSIAAIVRSPHAPALVDAYFDPTRGFAGGLFDGLDPGGLLADNPSDRFTVDDIAAASLLDVRFGPTAVRALLGEVGIRDALAATPTGVPLWEATRTDLDAATRLWDVVR